MPRKSNFRPQNPDEDPLYRFTSPGAPAQTSQSQVAPAPASHFSINGLTEQQTRVFALLSEGISNKQIARRLNISESTVKVYVSAILQVFGCENRTQAALTALRYLYGLPKQEYTRAKPVQTRIDEDSLLRIA